MKSVHHKLVFERRIEVLAGHFARLLPRDASVIDIGAGSGDLAVRIMQLRPDVKIEGVDILVRPETSIEVKQFDGKSIEVGDGHFDAAILVDVLHHTDDPKALLSEAARVARQGVCVKDHYSDNLVAEGILRFMDWVGNASHGVRLPYNYLSRSEWREIWNDLGLNPTGLVENVGLYPAPFSLVFDRKLHFVTFLEKQAVKAQAA